MIATGPGKAVKSCDNAPDNNPNNTSAAKGNPRYEAGCARGSCQRAGIDSTSTSGVRAAVGIKDSTDAGLKSAAPRSQSRSGGKCATAETAIAKRSSRCSSAAAEGDTRDVGGEVRRKTGSHEQPTKMAIRIGATLFSTIGNWMQTLPSTLPFAGTSKSSNRAGRALKRTLHSPFPLSSENLRSQCSALFG